MRPPRFRLRTLLIAVAVAAVLLAGSIQLWRAIQAHWLIDGYALTASHHSAIERQWLREAGKAVSAAQVERARRHAAYHAAMKRKYIRAIATPLAPLAPDPPPPK